MSLSVAMITLNAERVLEKSLASIAGIASEIVVIDSGSTDKTLEICEKFKARVIQADWHGFGPQKNMAIEACKEDWVLVLDSDEVVDQEMAEAIQKLSFQSPLGNEPVYLMKRRVVCFGKALRLVDTMPRLFEKRAARYNNKPVHESLEIEEGRPASRLLPGKVNHHTFDTLKEYLQKLKGTQNWVLMAWCKRVCAFRLHALYLKHGLAL